MYKRLLVVSDTPVFRLGATNYGLAPVVLELESLSDRFEEIIWIGYDFPDREGDPTFLPVHSSKIKMVFVPRLGGKSVIAHLKTLLFYPYFFYLILNYGKSAEVIHTRAPSHPAFVANLMSFFMKNKIWWQKFAGSWDPQTLPWFYKIQRRLLILSKHSKVTINGFWKNQPSHCISFENPCLTACDLKMGKQIAEEKGFEGPFVFVFIGRLDEFKGVDRIITALKSIPLATIKEVHFIGNGPKLDLYRQQTSFLEDKVIFHGFLGREKVHQYLKESHFLLLPSISEGFPKVIAEGACFGVIPIVSNVGSISHYINDSNGFLWKIMGKSNYSEVLKQAIYFTSKEDLKAKSRNLLNLAEDFSYQAFLGKLDQYIVTRSVNHK